MVGSQELRKPALSNADWGGRFYPQSASQVEECQRLRGMDDVPVPGSRTALEL
jgi:hypothetical protein